MFLEELASKKGFFIEIYDDGSVEKKIFDKLKFDT